MAECPWPEWECYMTCAINGCRKRRHAVTGWTCPACGKGNAPDVKGCVHCAKREPTSTTGNWTDDKRRMPGIIGTDGSTFPH